MLGFSTTLKPRSQRLFLDQEILRMAHYLLKIGRGKSAGRVGALHKERAHFDNGASFDPLAKIRASRSIRMVSRSSVENKKTN